VVGAHPRAYLPFARWRYGRDLAFGPGTEVVIEGFPRSANSFAVTAFRQAQGRDVQIAHHLHQPAQVLAAVDHDVPSIVLVREPREAILSYLIWQPHLQAKHAVHAYVGFHRPLLGHEDGYVVADFGQVTNDYGAVISRVNQRFGTAFEPFHHTEPNVALAFDEIEQTSRERRAGELVELAVARPSAERRRMKAALAQRFERETTRAQRDELDGLYRHFGELTA
jgi:hypothetical protein